ncbi:ATP-binding protein [Bacillus massiliigorillae]|uniref:ATP-binding protein n=1 Tax=Bacillus massiliigorillae TaxID=1243664 RepID=UPI0005A64429|nr:ATP-binding protein [Bacillus massiliigorillae]
MKSIQTSKVFQKNTILTSDNRCRNIDIINNSICKRKLLIDENGNEFCFYCSTIAAEDKEIKDSAEKALENEDVHKLMSAFKKKSLMNKDLHEATLDKYYPQNESQDVALETVKTYINEFDCERGLVLQGKPGLGKSHLASAIVKELIKKKYSGIFISLPRLMTELKATYNRKSALQEVEVLSALQNVNVLVLDDLGVEIDGKKDDAAAWAKGKIYEVVDSRVGKSTIYTTNFTAKQLIELYGERDFSRMVQYCDSIKIEGKNYRFKKFS